jgi:hypothetical protein
MNITKTTKIASGYYKIEINGGGTVETTFFLYHNIEGGGDWMLNAAENGQDFHTGEQIITEGDLCNTYATKREAIASLS